MVYKWFSEKIGEPLTNSSVRIEVGQTRILRGGI
jgi:hypothetical protein